MCEFKINLIDGKQISEVVREIVFGKIENGNIIFKGLGVEKEIPGGIITELNVISEEGASIEIIQSPVISPFLRFLEKIQENKMGNISNTDLINEWEITNEEIKNELKIIK